MLSATQLMPVARWSMVDAYPDPTDYMIYVPAVGWRRFFTFIHPACRNQEKCLFSHLLDKSLRVIKGI